MKRGRKPLNLRKDLEDRQEIKGARGRLNKVLHMMVLLIHGRHTIKSLAVTFQTSERGIYRYLDLLELLDISIDKDDEGRYFIAQDTCPFCGTEVKHG